MNNLIEKNAKIILDKASNCLSVSLSGFIPYEGIVRFSTYEWDMIRHYQLKNCIIDLREMGVYAPGVADFINLKWFEQMEKLGVKYLAFVVPENVFGKASMNKAHEVASKPGQMTTKHFKDQPSAKQWLEEVSLLELK